MFYIDPNGGSTEDAMEAKCSKVDHVEWTCIEPKQASYVRAIYWLYLIAILRLLYVIVLQAFACKSVKRTTKSLLECVEEQYFKYSVTHESQLWSLASKSGSVRQELSYECTDAHPPLSFTGWDETEFDNLHTEIKQNCNVKYIFLLFLNK